MTAKTTIKAIYLGNFAATDVYEGDFKSENTGFLVGTVRDHTQMQVATITSYDKDHDGVMEDDECNPYGDYITYNLGGGTVSTKTDGSIEANVQLTLADGSVRTVKVVAFQQQNGDLFISDLYNQGTLDNLSIAKVEITGITGTNYVGWFTNQSTDNTMIKPPIVTKDGYVEGDDSDNVIDLNYTGDPEGDRVDANDAILPGQGPNDDIIFGFDGNDTIDAGEGDDDVSGGDGDDLIYGNIGDDVITGDDGNDELLGDDGDDTLIGGDGDDTLRGGMGADLIEGGDGNDSVRANEGGDTILGGDGNDTLRGGEDDDTVDGGADDDLVFGGLGDDSVTGGDGDDEVRGNEGADTLDGGAGDDLIVADDPGDLNDYVTFVGVPVDPDPDNNRDLVTGGTGNDTILTGDDADTIYGNDGDDSIDSGIDADVVYGGDGDDYIDTFIGSDYVEGGDGDDTIIAGFDAFSDYTGDDPNLPNPFWLDPVTGLPAVTDPNRDDGRDTVFGGDGNDVIETGDDADVIFGEAGNDTINAGIDDDRIDGGSGDDDIIGGHGSDTIFGGAGDDVIDAGDPSLRFPPLDDASDPTPENDRDLVEGGSGDDTILGGDDADTLLGGAGDDVIDGGIDDDVIDGGAGDDSLLGGDGRDTILGGLGDDTIDGGDGADVLEGGEGDDLINGGNGEDTLLGGSGDDTLTGGTDDDALEGGTGDDVVIGETGNDTILGGDGDDTIDGGPGEDLVLGGAGDDQITGGQDNDIIFCGDGDDIVTGGDGADYLEGGDDRDLFIGGTDGDTVDGGAGGDDFDTLDLRGAAPVGGSLQVTITGPDLNGNGSDGFVTYRDGDGNVTGSFQFSEIEEIIPCFTPGTLIATPRGERLVEDLKVGDKVITRDNGLQAIRWIGAKSLTGRDFAKHPHLKPVLIRAGSLGNGLPERDTLYSPNHRVLINNEKTALYFDEREVLVAAKHLVGAPGVHEVDVMGTTYIHFMFDHHEVVLSNGSWTESFLPGDMALKGVGDAQRNEIFDLFPELRTKTGVQDYQSARRSLKKHEARLLLK